MAKISWKKGPPQLLKIEETGSKRYPDVNWHICGRANPSANFQWADVHQRFRSRGVNQMLSHIYVLCLVSHIMLWHSSHGLNPPDAKSHRFIALDINICQSTPWQLYNCHFSSQVVFFVRPWKEHCVMDSILTALSPGDVSWIVDHWNWVMPCHDSFKEGHRTFKRVSM